jgi:ABC-2 type transport system ATP-binding protein
VLTISGLSVSYGTTRVLDDIDLTVPDGEVVGFVGPNGAGKSTTMRAVMGLVTPDAGTLSWDGVPLDRAQRRRFGYMPEERGLYQKMAVRPQVEYFARMNGLDRAHARRSTDDWLERLGVTEHADTAVQSLSLGNQQRVQLAVALVHDPELLILDEPFSGLDPLGVDAVVGVLREQQRRGVPILFSSHQLDLVERLIDTVAMIKGGRLLFTESVATAHLGAVPRLRAVVDDPVPGWLDRVPGEVTTDPDGPEGSILVDPCGHGLNDVLAVLIQCGTVRSFGWDEPTLTGLFQEVMA